MRAAKSPSATLRAASSIRLTRCGDELGGVEADASAISRAIRAPTRIGPRGLAVAADHDDPDVDDDRRPAPIDSDAVVILLPSGVRRSRFIRGSGSRRRAP